MKKVSYLDYRIKLDSRIELEEMNCFSPGDDGFQVPQFIGLEDYTCCQG